MIVDVPGKRDLSIIGSMTDGREEEGT